jgi:hypothetical protein
MKTPLHFLKKIISVFIFSILIPFSVFAQWGALVNLTPNSMGAGLNENMGPCIGVSHDSVHVVWSDHRTQGWAIYYRHSFDTGATWSNPIALTDTTGGASMPVIAVNGKNIHVVYMDTLNGIRASFYIHSTDAGATWSASICLDTNTAFWPGVSVSGSTVLVTLDKRLTATNTEVFFMRSVDNGMTWSPETQITNANGRSEDQAMAVLGNDVHLSWNENRNGPMEIYSRNSTDLGVTWGPEIQITTTDSYSPSVCAFGNYVDVPFGNTTGGNMDVWFRQSSDVGVTYPNAMQQLSNNAVGEAYPFEARDGQNIYMVYLKFGTGPMYIHSTDGGATWTQPYNFGPGGFPFIAYTGTFLHVIWSNAGHIWYLHDPNGNPVVTGEVVQQNNTENKALIFPNPSNDNVTIQTKTIPDLIEVCDMTGRLITSIQPKNSVTQLSTTDLSEGVYLIRVKSGNDFLTQKLSITH